MTNADRQRRYRERRNAATVTEGVTPVTRNAEAVTELEPSLGWSSEIRRLRELVQEKDAEIARLKKHLAGANREKVVMPVAEESRAALVGEATKLGLPCIHDAVYGACRKLGCTPEPPSRGRQLSGQQP